MWGLCLLLLSWVGLSPVPYVANMIGTSVPAINLLISILMGYPIGVFYHKYIRDRGETYRNIFFAATGIEMAFYNFGISMYHNLIPALVSFASAEYFGPGKMNAIFSFVFNMAYLLTGYIMTESEDYDITWTMPQCVLTLKLIALSFDLWDGRKLAKGEELSANNRRTALEIAPSLLELIAFVYFPACFLVGPIFSFRRYKEFVEDKYPLKSEAQVYEMEGLKTLVYGLLYLSAFQIGVSVFDVKFMLSDEFWERSLLYRHYYSGMWAHFALYKYVSCWLLTEAACIRTGLSYNGMGQTSEGTPVTKWDGCNNIKLLRFETATKFQHYIDSFNCNTNHFAAEYIYKRLKFLGDRNLSQFFTLLFLALWHGVRSGYYMTFFNEFIIIYMEKELESIISRTKIYHTLWANKIFSHSMYVLLKIYTIVFMGWSLIPFDLKVYTKWMAVYHSLFYSGFLLFLLWPVVHKPLLVMTLRKLNVQKIDASTK